MADLSFTGTLTGSLGEDFLDCCGVPTTITLDPDETSWVALGRVTFVEVTGRGGNGGGGTEAGYSGGGGGGGGYANKNYPGVEFGDTVSYQSGTGDNDGSSWFKTAGTVNATAGEDGEDGLIASGGNGGAGGTGTAGDVTYSGNTVDHDGLTDGNGGEGGNAGGPGGDGTGGAGGPGGDASGPDYNGQDGDCPGGGGGGGSSGGVSADLSGGGGCGGEVKVTYITCP